MFPSLLPQILSILVFVLPQNGDPAERLFDNAQTFMNAGKYKEALTDFESIITNFNQSPYASKAMLEIGNYYLHTEKDFQQALGMYSRIQNEYPSSEAAPAAFFNKARIVDASGSSPAQLEGAVADLIRMINLFPGNAWEDGALFLLGKLNWRLHDYANSLAYFNRLEFGYPRSQFLPQAMLLGSAVTLIGGDTKRASLQLGRLQAVWPNTDEERIAASMLRLLSRFQDNVDYELDRGFFGATPKKFQNPDRVGIGWDGGIGVGQQKGVTLGSLQTSELAEIPTRELEDFCRDHRGRLVQVFGNRLVDRDGKVIAQSLNHRGEVLKKIRSAAIDTYQRIFVVDGDTRDVVVFGPDGNSIKALGLSKPRLVRVFRDRAWVLNSNASGFDVFDASLSRMGSGPTGMGSIQDFNFDPAGNLYALNQRGAELAIFNPKGTLIKVIKLRDGTFPLKQAQGIAVDASGAIYLADRRGGSVYRIH